MGFVMGSSTHSGTSLADPAHNLRRLFAHEPQALQEMMDALFDNQVGAARGVGWGGGEEVVGLHTFVGGDSMVDCVEHQVSAGGGGGQHCSTMLLCQLGTPLQSPAACRPGRPSCACQLSWT